MTRLTRPCLSMTPQLGRNQFGEAAFFFAEPEAVFGEGALVIGQLLRLKTGGQTEEQIHGFEPGGGEEPAPTPVGKAEIGDDPLGAGCGRAADFVG